MSEPSLGTCFVERERERENGYKQNTREHRMVSDTEQKTKTKTQRQYKNKHFSKNRIHSKK